MAATTCETRQPVFSYPVPADCLTAFEPVFVVPELEDEAVVRQKAVRFIGAVAAGTWHAEREGITGGRCLSAEMVAQGRDVTFAREAATPQRFVSLHEAIQAAAAGDAAARRMVKANVSADVVERTLKAGHITEVELTHDAAGVIGQHGQAMEAIQANSLRYAAGSPPMRRRVEAETRNAFRLQQCQGQGLLEQNCFVVFSRAADDMSGAEMAAAGFFTDTMSCAIQVTSEQGGRLVTETAFVAGAARPGEPRHDQMAIEALGRRLGVDLTGKSAAEVLDTPLLVPRCLLPEGALNLVELYDDCAGGLFFGEAKPRQDYRQYRQDCRRREASFQPKIEQIVSSLLAEAATITSPTAATRRLNTLSGQHMIELAIKDRTIDPEVFGRAAAARIEVARQHFDRGHFELAQSELAEAIKRDASSSCPGAGMDSGSPADSGSGEASAGTPSESDACEFVSRECPICHAKKVKTLVTRRGGKKRISGSCGCSITVAS